MSYFFSEFCSRDCLWEFCYDYFHYVHSASPTLFPMPPLVSKDLNLVCNLSWMILGACYVGSKFLNSATFPNTNKKEVQATPSWWGLFNLNTIFLSNLQEQPLQLDPYKYHQPCLKPTASPTNFVKSSEC